jgi:hypothetical protein
MVLIVSIAVIAVILGLTWIGYVAAKGILEMEYRSTDKQINEITEVAVRELSRAAKKHNMTLEEFMSD